MNEVTLETTILENRCLFLDMSEEFGSKKLEEGEATTDSTKEIQKSAVNEEKNDVLLKGKNVTCLSIFGSSLKSVEDSSAINLRDKSLVESQDQATRKKY